MLANLLASAAAVAASVPRAKAGSAEQQGQAPRQSAQTLQPRLPLLHHALELVPHSADAAGKALQARHPGKAAQGLARLLGAIPDPVHSLPDAAERSGDTLHGIDDQVKPALLALGHQSCSMSFCSFLVRSAHQARSRAVIRSSSEGGQWYSQASRVRASSQSAGHSRKKRR